MRLAWAALCAVSLFGGAAAVATAQQPVSMTILVCELRYSPVTVRVGSGTVELPVYTYVVDTAAGTTRFVGVYTDGRRFDELLGYEGKPGFFSSCSLKNMPNTMFVNATVEDVTAVGAVSGTAAESNGSSLDDGARFYTGLTISYQQLRYRETVSKSSWEISPEEKARSLESFKARMVLPKG